MSEQDGVNSADPSPPLPPLLGPAVARAARRAAQLLDEAEAPSYAAAVPAAEPMISSDLPPLPEGPLLLGLEEVAERLEAIASSLRDRSPRELLGTWGEAAGEADPLEVLITGYALGFSQARQQGAELSS